MEITIKLPAWQAVCAGLVAFAVIIVAGLAFQAIGWQGLLTIAWLAGAVVMAFVIGSSVQADVDEAHRIAEGVAKREAERAAEEQARG